MIRTQCISRRERTQLERQACPSLIPTNKHRGLSKCQFKNQHVKMIPPSIIRQRSLSSSHNGMRRTKCKARLIFASKCNYELCNCHTLINKTNEPCSGRDLIGNVPPARLVHSLDIHNRLMGIPLHLVPWRQKKIGCHFPFSHPRQCM